MKIHFLFAICLLLAASACTMFAQGGGGRGATDRRRAAPDPRWWWAWPSPPDPQSVDRGKVQFAQSCGSCHAQNATGTSKGPNLMRSALVRHDVDGSATGKTLWKAEAPGLVINAPITYRLDGRQYVLKAIRDTLYAWALPEGASSLK